MTAQAILMKKMTNKMEKALSSKARLTHII
jgi:hypothetical protein